MCSLGYSVAAFVATIRMKCRKYTSRDPWPITVEMFMSDFQRFFYFRKRMKNKKR